ncbi:MAG: hypothetical protein R2716_11725 [Microthrixaceae bacterium]
MGYYDPTDGKLRVRGDLTPYRREVIVHELTHALDDQLFDLSGLERDGLLDSGYLAELVAIEGSAERVRSRYAASFQPTGDAPEPGRAAGCRWRPGAADDPDHAADTHIRAVSRRCAVPARRAIFNSATLPGPTSRSPATRESSSRAGLGKYLVDEQATEVPRPAHRWWRTCVRSGEFGPLLISLVLREESSTELDP